MEVTSETVERFLADGFVAPISLFCGAEVAVIREMIDEHLSGGGGAPLYELTDAIDIRKLETPDGPACYAYNDGDGGAKVTTFGFLMNMWRRDDRFLRMATSPKIATIARTLLGVKEVLLFEDNVIFKLPRTKYLPWHQDCSYWPLAEPRAVTFWVALDDIDASNGALEVAPGTQALGPRLPVAFGDEKPFMADEWPGVQPVPKDPRAAGYSVVTYDLRAGECGVHDAMIWHGSTANRSDRTRYALVLRYVASGTIWLGPERMAYDDIGCAPGEPLTGKHFPVAGDPASSDRTRRWTLPNQ